MKRVSQEKFDKWIKKLLSDFYYSPPEFIEEKLRIRLKEMLYDFDINFIHSGAWNRMVNKDLEIFISHLQGKPIKEICNKWEMSSTNVYSRINKIWRRIIYSISLNKKKSKHLKSKLIRLHGIINREVS